MANASNSDITTWLGPVVSLRTAKGHAHTYKHFHLDSGTTLEVEGTFTMDGAATYSAGASATFASGATLTLAGVAPIKFSGITTASPTSSFIPDGHFSVVSHSGNSIVLALRSGATTYRFTNDAGGVL